MNRAEPGVLRPRNAAIVVNTRARSGEQALADARDLLTRSGVPVSAAYPVSDPARLPETVREVVRSGYDLLVLGGGDGTVSSVVDFLVDTQVVLGLLPLGTANDFARTLQIPANPPDACHTISAGKVVDVDLGLAEDNYFVNVASVGLSTGVTQALTSGLKKRAGWMAYSLASIRALFSHRPFTTRLSFPDGDHDPLEVSRVLQVAVGNGRFYGGGNLVAPDAGIDDSTLDVYVIRLGRGRDLLGTARSFRSGNFIHGDNVTHRTTGRITVETDPAMAMNIDGEIVAHTTQEITVARNALRVLVPQHSTTARLDAS